MLWSPPYQVIIPAYFLLVPEWRLLCVEWTSVCSSQLSLLIVEWVVTLSFSHSPTDASTYCFLDTWIFVLFFSFLTEHTHSTKFFFPYKGKCLLCLVSSLLYLAYGWGLSSLPWDLRSRLPAVLMRLLFLSTHIIRWSLVSHIMVISAIDRAHGDRVAYGVLWVWWHRGLGPWTLRNYSLFRYLLELIPSIWHKAVWGVTWRMSIGYPFIYFWL